MVVIYVSNSHRHFLKIPLGVFVRTQEELGAMPCFAENVGNTIGIIGFVMIEGVMVFVAFRM